MNSKRMLRIAPLATAFVLVLAGCGGSDGDGAAATTTGGSTTTASSTFVNQVLALIGATSDTSEPAAVESSPAATSDTTEPDPVS